MRKPVRSLWTSGSILIVASIALPALAHAGMGNRDTVPKYHPEPCQGDACRADDTRSGLPCEGLLCSFSSAKAMQPPMTAARAADAQRAATTAEPAAGEPTTGEPTKPIAAVPVATKSKAARTKQAKAKTTVSSKTNAIDK